MNKSEAAFHLCLTKLSEQTGPLFLWTFTLKTVMDLDEARTSWNCLLTALLRTYPQLHGLRVYELHPGGHGLHVHLICNTFMHVDVVRRLASKCGWGRIHAKRSNLDQAQYLAKNLSKRRPPCFKGWRLWSGVGDWERTKVSDIIRDSLFSRTYRAVKEWLGWNGNRGFFERMQFVRRVVMATIEHDWPDGRGPGGRPYSDFDPDDVAIYGFPHEHPNQQQPDGEMSITVDSSETAETRQVVQ